MKKMNKSSHKYSFNDSEYKNPINEEKKYNPAIRKSI